MSKEAALRAMREARYNQRMANAGAAAPSRPAGPTTAAAARPPIAPVAPVASPATDALCGHRSMNGRTCTREQGHTAKNHRYS